MKLRQTLVSIAILSLAACSSASQFSLPAAGNRAPDAMRAVPIATPTPTPPPSLLAPVLNLAANLLPVCSLTNLAGVSCTAIRRGDIPAVLDSNIVAIAGYHASDLQKAYKLPSGTAGTGQTIGIVVAFDNPKAQSDLQTYRARFGLPACTASTGCFRKVGQSGSATLPAGDMNWGQEISIDLDMASAVCPKCRLLLVEANGADLTNLAAAVNTAVSMGATVVSNSYAAPESAQTVATNSLWNHPGVPIVAGSGDTGSGVFWPAASSYVTAVGGTTLQSSVLSARGFSESPWKNASGGRSASGHSVSDVSAIADPQTGVAAYDTYVSSGTGGWMVFGGTSVATPIVAGAYALAGNGRMINDASYVRAHASALNVVGQGYNLQSGLGSPNGVGAF